MFDPLLEWEASWGEEACKGVEFLVSINIRILPNLAEG